MLFSEPKIPHFVTPQTAPSPVPVSVLFSEPKIPHCLTRGVGTRAMRVSVLFSEPKIPHTRSRFRPTIQLGVSVLFSEPKIPHQRIGVGIEGKQQRFSALQRAENSSPLTQRGSRSTHIVSVLFSEPKIPHEAFRHAIAGAASLFQCSSASRKFLTYPQRLDLTLVRRFSALQRAENSSLCDRVRLHDVA